MGTLRWKKGVNRETLEESYDAADRNTPVWCGCPQTHGRLNPSFEGRRNSNAVSKIFSVDSFSA
jgi:hypothetical protein